MQQRHPSFETITVDTLEVVCDGGQGGLGHPRVYLHIESEEGVIVCPYCSRTYRHASTGHAA